MDFNIKVSNGQLLKGIIRSPGDNPAAVVVFVHGIGEHIRRYSHWSDNFLKENIAFAGLDLPGHGLSEGRRGHIKSRLILEEMIDILLKTAGRTFPGVPVYLYGHSMGGGIVLDYLIRRNPKIRGAIVTGPWLKLAFEPSATRLFMASVFRYIIPGLVQSSGLNVDYLSHDKAIVEKYVKDPLVHDKISVSLFNIAMNSASYSLKNAAEMKTPLLIVHGSEDMICSPSGSREFAEKAGNVKLKIWENSYHELHNEPFGDEVFKFIIDWIRYPSLR